MKCRVFMEFPGTWSTINSIKPCILPRLHYPHSFTPSQYLPTAMTTASILKTFTCSALVLLSITLKAQHDSIPFPIEQQKEALAVAEKWTTLLNEGENLEELMSISAVPFAVDRSKILTTDEELQKLYQKIFEKKGKFDGYVFSYKIAGYKNEILDNGFPIVGIQVWATIEEGERLVGDSALITLSISNNELKVIGFSD